MKRTEYSGFDILIQGKKLKKSELLSQINGAFRLLCLQVKFCKILQRLISSFLLPALPISLHSRCVCISCCHIWLIEANGNFVKNPLLKVCSICPSPLYSFAYIAKVSCKYSWLWRGKYVQMDTSQPVKTVTATYGPKKHGLIF